MKTYRTRRSGGTLAYLVATLLCVSGLVLVGYSFLIVTLSPARRSRTSLPATRG